MTNFSHDNREPPMLNDSERPVLPSLNSTTSGHSGLKIFIFVALFGQPSNVVYFVIDFGVFPGLPFVIDFGAFPGLPLVFWFK